MGDELLFRGTGRKPSFTQWLRQLKEDGCNILMTGDVSLDASALASRAYFSTAEDEHRYRILGLIGLKSIDPERWLPDHVAVEDSDSWVIDHCSSRRSAPEAALDVTSDLGPMNNGDIRHLCTEAQSAIAFYEEQSNGFEPAELRVGIDSLDMPLEEDRSGTKTALRMLTTSVRGVDGMGHYHVRTDDDSELVEELMPMFDARIELRQRPKLNPEQRWYSPALDKRTGWVEL